MIYDIIYKSMEGDRAYL